MYDPIMPVSKSKRDWKFGNRFISWILPNLRADKWMLSTQANKQLQIRWVERLARCRGTLTAGLPFYLSGEGRRTTEIWALGRKTEGKKWKKGKSGVERRDLNKKRETNKGMKCSQDRSAEKPTHKWKNHSFSSHATIINQWKTPLTMTVQSICHKVMKIITVWHLLIMNCVATMCLFQIFQLYNSIFKKKSHEFV